MTNENKKTTEQEAKNIGISGYFGHTKREVRIFEDVRKFFKIPLISLEEQARNRAEWLAHKNSKEYNPNRVGRIK